ncbi:MAG: hypothetical protein LUF85_04650 [Bacteroides sp.]|nr:hypothetical protein [Bacteroides sp.]
MKAKYIVTLWAISYIAIAATIAFSMLWSLIFLLPFVVSSVYIGRHSAQMLRELKLDMDTDDDFI